jgi:hypothetical protein
VSCHEIALLSGHLSARVGRVGDTYI